MKNYTYIAEVAEIHLDTDLCIGCSLCTTVCPHGLFEVQEHKAVIKNKNDCMECGACALNCPVDAITVTPGVGCAALIISRWLAKVGIPSKGCC